MGLTLLTIVICLGIGRVTLAPGRVLAVLLSGVGIGGPVEALERSIVLSVRLPRTLLAAPSIVVLATLVHLLAVSIQRRRREIAVLRSLGFGTRDVLLAVLTQSTALVVVALVIGLPIGIIAGRVLWSIFGATLGVPVTPALPIGWIAGGAVVVVFLANLIAVVPGLVASRIPASAALRSE